MLYVFTMAGYIATCLPASFRYRVQAEKLVRDGGGGGEGGLLLNLAQTWGTCDDRHTIGKQHRAGIITFGKPKAACKKKSAKLLSNLNRIFSFNFRMPAVPACSFVQSELVSYVVVCICAVCAVPEQKIIINIRC